jgi:hypothetical protein
MNSLTQIFIVLSFLLWIGITKKLGESASQNMFVAMGFFISVAITLLGFLIIVKGI